MVVLNYTRQIFNVYYYYYYFVLEILSIARGQEKKKIKSPYKETKTWRQEKWCGHTSAQTVSQ